MGKVKAIKALDQLQKEKLLRPGERKNIEKAFKEYLKEKIPFTDVNEPDKDKLDVESGERIGSS